MEETIDKKIENILNNEKIKKIIEQAGRGEVAPVNRVSNLIGEIYTYCFVHNDGNDLDINNVISYVKIMSDAYFECHGSEKLMQDIRAKELGKSIAQRLNIDISSGMISKEEEQSIQDYFLKNYVKNGYVMHSFPGAVEASIREYGFSSSKRIWDNDEIMRVAHIFEDKDVISPVGGYSHYSGGGMYVENNTRDVYWHALSAPEWFKWFTSANHNKNSSSIEDSPYYLRNYEGCKQNVVDLCVNAGLNEDKMSQVMSMFEKNWKVLGTERMCVALIPKSVIGKDNIEEATIPGQSVIETIKTVLSDGRGQYKEHDGNDLKQTVTEKEMIIMGLPNSREIFGEHVFDRETKKELYDPKLVLDMIFRVIIACGFELSKEKIDSIIETLRQVHNGSPEVEKSIQEYNERVSSLASGIHTITKTEILKVAKKDNVIGEKENAMQIKEKDEKEQNFLIL